MAMKLILTAKQLFTFAQIVGIWIGAGKGAVGGHSTFDDEGYPVLDALLTDFYKVNT